VNNLNYSTYSYRHAEIILNSKYAIKNEVETTLRNLEVEHGEKKTSKSKVLPHDLIQQAFVENGWNAEQLVTEDTIRKHFFDLYKEKVAIEIEFARNEFLYRDYFRFLLAYNKGIIDVGVIITLDPKAKEVYKYQSVRPDIEYAKDDFQWLMPVLGVPIWVIGIY
jgi:hypothetical protein